MDEPHVLLRARLLAEGWSDAELRRRRQSGELVAVGRGGYLPADDPRLTTAAAAHALRIESGEPLRADDSVISHVSAAVLHGLPVWGLPLGRVHRTRDRRTGGRRTPTAHLHTAPLDAEDVTSIDGRLVTAVARTLADIGRTEGFEQTVVLADAALHRRLLDAAALRRVLARTSGWRGAPPARRALGFADGRSESVGESRSRVAILRAGLPVPDLQWEVSASHAWLGRVDFAWPGVVGEFDGRVKYGKYLRPGQDAGDAVFAEKQREDRIRDEGLRVVRWVWDDLRWFGEVAERLRRAFAAAR
ncbi:hypothetical protein I4I73_21565 [Pseudonocardia sp. KRD-184]|uniref:Transcriptional regulator, AbiEi antitoxin, Type IV TA system n=1 Tax=Pseudonocardia oceani TaxID=2792013 RepID=A0ABS6UCT2_9PSEU|nr:hypothetical protein [Pseudonocardia oceani]MBW0091403.1 hypothetical protein [Pseudonocardia oceani]MBW0098580.1 hypothetical protein [Pseudonocardia oceani]MBW0111088.1 hypothetical protein [Pseudonocardia oceani]MBW0124961.1 hypothetical protein [Pseudonocardia oceani]MBW0129763.1 hypothetical protein [Pseudonocardia oceani]